MGVISVGGYDLENFTKMRIDSFSQGSRDELKKKIVYSNSTIIANNPAYKIVYK